MVKVPLQFHDILFPDNHIGPDGGETTRLQKRIGLNLPFHVTYYDYTIKIL